MPAPAIRFDVLTLFPAIFSGYMTQSLLKLAIDNLFVRIDLWDFRAFASGAHKSVDDRPYGGGPGMVIMPGPVFDCVEHVQAADPTSAELIMLTPTGRRLDQRLVEELAELPRMMLLCGRYEGFDERVRLGLRPREVSIGDFVCNGGEVPAMVLIDTIIRLIPGVLGDAASAADDSHNEAGRLEFPQYTRPRSYRGMDVPPVLLGGNHQAVAAWRDEQSRLRSHPPTPADRAGGPTGADQ